MTNDFLYENVLIVLRISYKRKAVCFIFLQDDKKALTQNCLDHKVRVLFSGFGIRVDGIFRRYLEKIIRVNVVIALVVQVRYERRQDD